MNFNQKLLDSTLKIQTEMIQASRSHYEKNILPLLEDTRRQLVKELDNLTDTNKSRITSLFKQTDALISDYYKQIGKVDRDERIKAARYTVEKTIKTFNDEVPTIAKSLDLKRISRIADNTLFGSETNKRAAGVWWQKQEDYLKEAYQTEIRKMIAADTPISKMVQAIRGTRRNKYTDGIMNITYKQAKALARSSIINVSNQARLDVYAENSDIIKGIMWSSTLDGRTTPICIALDGKQWTIPKYEPVNHSFDFPGATAHFACRSTQITITKSYDELKGNSKKKVKEAGKISSFTGRVPQEKSYSTFLREQGADFQDSVLGKHEVSYLGKVR